MVKRVLLIDDNKDLVDGLAELAEMLGHDVAVAITGGQGIAAIRERSFDVIFIDIHVPDADGVDLARCLIDEGSEAQIILMTGYSEPDMPARVARLLGSVELLIKPLDPATVLDRLE
jgi:DNA-binding response OmpR family regulator